MALTFNGYMTGICMLAAVMTESITFTLLFGIYMTLALLEMLAN